jgi:peptide/nickel transport system ATP-binding protein
LALLEVKGLSVSYFVFKKEYKAVEDVSFELEEQQTLGVVGESGSGKSTLGLALLKLIPPQGKITGGKILIEGEDIASLGKEELRNVRGAKVAMIFQDPMTSLNPLMNVGDHFVEAIRAHFPGVPREEALAKARKILRQLNISEERLKDYPHQLSGGMKQRIMIGLGLSLDPKLLIADEPTTALDVVIEAQILELLRELKDSLKLSMILITHNLGVVAEVADRIAIMYGGEIMELAETKVLFKKPLFPYTKLLLKLVPNILTDSTSLEWITGSPPDLSLRYQGCKFAARCPSVFARCRVEAPRLREVESGHFVACHLY